MGNVCVVTKGRTLLVTTQVSSSLKKSHVYFLHLYKGKMNETYRCSEFFFYPLQNVNREMTIKASNGTEYYLVDVIAQILKHLKIELIDSLKHAGHPHEATDFDWVITVPAIWRARGKQMMREAGYKVTLVFYIMSACLGLLTFIQK